MEVGRKMPELPMLNIAISADSGAGIAISGDEVAKPKLGEKG
jgi:hypothetical protein